VPRKLEIVVMKIAVSDQQFKKVDFVHQKIYKTNLKVFASPGNGSILTQAELKSHVQQLQLYLAV
jgi:hypothetical protein